MVLGIGNLLMQDDGVGVHVVRALEKLELPDEVEVVDGGTHSYDLVDFFSQADWCIVVDAMHAGGTPGMIYRAPFEELGLKPNPNIASLHEISFAEAMNMVRLEGYDPKVIVYGVEPQTVALGLELTDCVAGKVPRLLELIQEDIEKILASDFEANNNGDICRDWAEKECNKVIIAKVGCCNGLRSLAAPTFTGNGVSWLP
jgi:hydrogenase maturation protease